MSSSILSDYNKKTFKAIFLNDDQHWTCWCSSTVRSFAGTLVNGTLSHIDGDPALQGLTMLLLGQHEPLIKHILLNNPDPHNSIMYNKYTTKYNEQAWRFFLITCLQETDYKINSSALGRCGCDIKSEIFNFVSNILIISCGNAVGWLPQDVIGYQSILVLNGLVTSYIKPLPDPILTTIFVTLWRH